MKRSGLIAAAAAALMMSAPAAAQSISYSGRAFYYNPIDNIDVPGFDASLGALGRVDIQGSFSGFFAGPLTSFDYDGMPAPTQFYLDILGPVAFNLGTIQFTQTAVPTNSPVTISGIGDYNFRYSGDVRHSLSASQVDQFITSSYLRGDVSIPNAVVRVTAPGAFFNSFWLDAAQTEVNYTVTYFFSAVPEPASWAMMIVGVGLVGGGLRRRSVRVAYTA